MPRKQGIGRKDKQGTGRNKGRKGGRVRVNVAHRKPPSSTPIKPIDTLAPAALAVTDPCAHASPAIVTRTNLVHAMAVAGTSVQPNTPSTYYYRVIKRERDELSEQSDDEMHDVRLGFITLESKESTFLDARSAIQEDMDPESLPGETWKFYLPSLGAVSHRQEKKLGPVASFLQKTFGSVHAIGDGSVDNQFHLVIVGVNSRA